MSSINVKHGMFPDEDTTNVSKEFEIKDSTAMIQIKGWQEGDCASIEYYFGDECDGSWEPFNPSDSCQLSFCHCQNTFLMETPGRFRVVLSNSEDNHINDLSWFSEVEMQITKFNNKSCC